jgi:hypothetical protein
VDLYQNNKEIQTFNTFDVLSIVVCFALVMGVSFLIFRNHLESQKSVEAKNYVEKLAQEIASRPVISAQENGGRLPASVAVNLDPWGDEYKYSVVRNSYGQPIYIMVLSAGPDHKFNTDLPTTLTFSESQMDKLKFNGDDVGTLKSFR